jgi:putative oxidoreductase
MKNVILFFRITLGLILITLPICYFFNLIPELENTGDFKAFQIGLVPSVYLVPISKVVEFLCGLSFLAKKYVTLSNIIVLPVTINILFINFFTSSPIGFSLSLFIFCGNIVMFYAYWKHYKHLFIA